MVNEYRVPTGLFVPALVLEHNGVLYSFGATLRSGESAWNEVKGNLPDLRTLDLKSEEIAEYLVNTFEENP